MCQISTSHSRLHSQTTTTTKNSEHFIGATAKFLWVRGLFKAPTINKSTTSDACLSKWHKSQTKP